MLPHMEEGTLIVELRPIAFNRLDQPQYGHTRLVLRSVRIRSQVSSTFRLLKAVAQSAIGAVRPLTGASCTAKDREREALVDGELGLVEDRNEYDSRVLQTAI